MFILALLSLTFGSAKSSVTPSDKIPNAPLATASLAIPSLKANTSELGLPLVRSFSPKAYSAQAQNWAIVQDLRDVIYVGNGDGVLEFDGVRWRLIRVKNNTLVRSLAVDAQGRVYAEVELQKSAVEEKNKEILASQRFIQTSKMAALGTMTAGVAHEINNPTNFASAAVYMMKDEISEIKIFIKQVAGGDNADPKVIDAFNDKFTKLIELVKTAAEGTNRIKMIVEDLRTFARLDDAKKTKAKITDLLISTVHLIQTQYDRIEITMQLDFTPEIFCFPSKLNQVFMNIIVNACQAIVSKQSSNKDFEGKVVVSTTEQHGQLIVHFKDNGCGMDEVTLQRIFELFYTTKGVGTGTGLGMAITFGIIEEHGGSIEVKSTVDEASQIVLKFDV